MRKISDQWFEQQRKLYRQELKNLRTLGGQESAEHWSEDEQRLYFEGEESEFEAVVAKAEEQIKQLFDECGKDIEDQQDRYRYWSTNAWSAALVAHMEQQRLEFLHTDANNVLNLMRLTIWIRLRLVDITCTRFFSDNSLLERMEIGFAEHQKQVCMYMTKTVYVYVLVTSIFLKKKRLTAQLSFG